MVEARDIIANALRGPQPSVKDSEAFIVSDYDAHMVSANIVLAALTAAGWTLAPPGSRVVPEGGEWQPIETAPKDGTAVLTYYSDSHGMRRYSIRYWSSGAWCGRWQEAWSDEWRQIRPNQLPSHWMPLPEPPALRALAGAKP